MRSRYPYHYSPTKEALEKAGETALFVFDTNALLDVLRLSPNLADKTIRVISSYQSRIKIPNQVDIEYHRRILETPAKMGNVVNQCIGNFDYPKIETIFKSFFKIPKDLLPFPKDCMDGYLKKFQAVVDEVLEDLKALRSHYNGLYLHQDYQYKISDILQTQILPGFTEDELKRIKAEGLERYENEIPPGYLDDSKDEDRKYGDLIIWKEILCLASDNKDKAIFFISNERKDDWVYKKYKKTWGPRLELLEEFGKFSDKIFYIYTLDQFLRHFGKDTLSKDDIEVISESVEKDSETDEIKASVKATSTSDFKVSREQPESKKVSGAIINDDKSEEDVENDETEGKLSEENLP